MKITKLKKISNGKYKIFLDNNDNIILYEDVIINNNLLISKKIDEKLLDKLIKQNNDVLVYNMAIDYISIRMRSIKEIKEYLTKKEIGNDLIKSITERLIKQGYLNDFKFAKAYTTDKFILSNDGPNKIKKGLLKHGVNQDIINEVIEQLDYDKVRDKLSRLLKKQVKIRKDSINSLKVKLTNYFINLGYDKDMIIKELSSYNLKSDKNKLKKDYEKLYNKYKTKYEKSKLTYFITQKLYIKGYTSNDIESVIKDK